MPGDFRAVVVRETGEYGYAFRDGFGAVTRDGSTWRGCQKLPGGRVRVLRRPVFDVDVLAERAARQRATGRALRPR